MDLLAPHLQSQCTVLQVCQRCCFCSLIWKVNHSGFYWSKRWWGGSGISWTMCKLFAPLQTVAMPVPHHSALPLAKILSFWCSVAAARKSTWLHKSSLGTRPHLWWAWQNVPVRHSPMLVVVVTCRSWNAAISVPLMLLTASNLLCRPSDNCIPVSKASA